MPGRPATLDRLELRVERLQLVFRFTYAFHAREVRFECDRGQGFQSVFPEIFSFHTERHDPAEFFIQLDDLARKPHLLAPEARRRDSELLISRLLLAAPRYLEGVLHRLEDEGRMDASGLARVYSEVALLAQILIRFSASWPGAEKGGLLQSTFQARKLALHALLGLMERRVSPAYLAAYAEGSAPGVEAADDLSEAGFFHILASGEPAVVDRSVVQLAERAFYRWLDGICLDEDNGAFEAEDTPFENREAEVMQAICSKKSGELEHGRDLIPFLRRPGNRDCLRVLGRLKTWFLRRYDIRHAAMMIHHAEFLAKGVDDSDLALSRHRPRNYLAALVGLALPFVVGAFAYDAAPRFFDVFCALELVALALVVLWFVFYRFLFKRDLTFFHAAVPRIPAGIIVGFLPIFFVDEVWGLANLSWITLSSVVLLLGAATFIYLYVEVDGRLADSELAFQRARQIFLLGILQATGVGMLLTGLVGRFMVLRNWGNGDPAETMATLQSNSLPFIGELPRIVGVEPFFTFPAAVFLMAFMSFFIGTFLQLMWEDNPITEPL